MIMQQVLTDLINETKLLLLSILEQVQETWISGLNYIIFVNSNKGDISRKFSEP